MKCLMTYVRSQSRWTKGYKGRTYSVSVKQLGERDGVKYQNKEQSAHAANLWWEDRQREIDAEDRAARDTPESLAARQFDRLADAMPARLTGAEPFDAYYLHTLYTQNPAEAVRLELDEPGRAAEALARLNRKPTEGRSVGEQVAEFLALIRATDKDVATHRYYDYSLRRFVAFLGDRADVSVITPAKWEQFFIYLSGKVKAGEYAAATAKETIKTARKFVQRLAKLGYIPLPANLTDHSFALKAKRFDTFTPEEVRALLAVCTGRSAETRLFILLQLNTGMLQSDVADLGTEEVDWEHGTITRQRSKRQGKEEALTVCYQLWPETFRLLKQYRQDHRKVLNEKGSARVLLTSEGRPLCARWWDADKGQHGGFRSYDTVASRWRVLRKRTGTHKSPKDFRKTSSSALAKHPQYKFYAQYFLAQAPDTIADRHYVTPSQAEFNAAVAWLRGELGLADVA